MSKQIQNSGFKKHLFLCEIEFQSKVALRAQGRLSEIGHGLDMIDIWSAIQSILIAAGNISKILWPTKKESQSRGLMLRELLDVDKNSPLIDRKFRNLFEHYDERIDNWFMPQRSASFKDFCLGPPQGFHGQFPSGVHRGYDYTTETLSYQGESVNLGVLVRAIAEIQQKCRTIIFV
jgi:hypothetical protein